MFKLLFYILIVEGFQKKFINRQIIKSFNDLGDLSGDYQLSGLWKIQIESTESYKEFKSPNQISWSGNKWSSPNRNSIIFDSFFVNLESNGKFSSPISAYRSEFRGIWYCINDELFMSRCEYGYNSIESYSGIYLPENGTIFGTFTFGEIEPFYVGTFKMTQLLKSFNPIIKNLDTSNKKSIFRTNKMFGNWQLTFESDSGFSNYNIILHKNLTWETINYFGKVDYKLAGNWNIYSDSIDITSGIHGQGNKIWLWVRRFGKIPTISKKVNLEQDRLYIGLIYESPNRNKTGHWYNFEFQRKGSEPRNIKGDVCIGWTTEPHFIGTFTMKPYFDTNNINSD
tara:strand:+ start:709 stop:1728 length:1020 start_codon:yes stop_codon:yes gene_type:complete